MGFGDADPRESLCFDGINGRAGAVSGAGESQRGFREGFCARGAVGVLSEVLTRYFFFSKLM